MKRQATTLASRLPKAVRVRVIYSDHWKSFSFDAVTGSTMLLQGGHCQRQLDSEFIQTAGGRYWLLIIRAEWAILGL
jgi:hypothetical protein